MNGKYLEEVTEERDLDVIILSDFKCSKQCLKAVSTASRVLGMIKSAFSVRVSKTDSINFLHGHVFIYVLMKFLPLYITILYYEK